MAELGHSMVRWGFGQGDEQGCESHRSGAGASGSHGARTTARRKGCLVALAHGRAGRWVRGVPLAASERWAWLVGLGRCCAIFFVHGAWRRSHVAGRFPHPNFARL